MKVSVKHRKEANGDITAEKMTFVAESEEDRYFLDDIDVLRSNGTLVPAIDLFFFLVKKDQIVMTEEGWKYNPTLPPQDVSNVRQKGDMMFG